MTAPQKFRANTLYKFAVSSYGVSKSDYTLKARIESKSGKVVVEGKFVVKQSGEFVIRSFTFINKILLLLHKKYLYILFGYIRNSKDLLIIIKNNFKHNFKLSANFIPQIRQNCAV